MRYGVFWIYGLMISFSSDIAFAKRGAPPEPPACSAPAKEPAIDLPYTTGYAPGLGGVNGNCNGGSSKDKGFDACKNTMHSYTQNKNVKFIHVAAQQKGGSAKVFGCFARTNVLQLRKIHTGRECDIFAVADHYAPSRNADRIGKTSVDVEVARTDKEYRKLGGLDQKVPGGKIECLARFPGVQNREKPNGKRTVSGRPAKATKRHRSRA